MSEKSLLKLIAVLLSVSIALEIAQIVLRAI